MKPLRFLFGCVKAAAIVADCLFVPLSLLAGMAWMAADVGVNEAWAGLGWALLSAATALVVLAALVAPAQYRPLVWAAYGGVLFQLAASLRQWYEHFNQYSELSPPIEAVVFGGLGVLNAAALAMNRPLRITPLRKGQ